VQPLLLFYLFLSLAYSAFAIWLWIGLRRMRCQPQTSVQPKVSVIIPARNEAAQLGRCLAALQQQSYPDHLYEIIVVDDASTDDTATVARAFRVRYFLSAQVPVGWSPKKAALQLGIRHSAAEIILSTDADCVASPQWIETMVRYFTPDVSAVVSWVDIQENLTWLSRLEALDVSALQIVGAAAIGHGHPFLANGANWGYRRELFNQANGFDGIAAIASGDDDLLLQKMSRCGRRIVFADEPSCRIRTGACPSLSAFLMQRLRWASKTSHYPKALIALEGFIFIYHSALLLLSMMVLVKPVWGLFLLNKIFWDAVVLQVSRLQKVHPRLWRDFLLAQWWQVLYILLIGVVAWQGRFVWKGRSYRRGILEGEKRI
jgi:cellulose synthase/poly-beta-1,6-N-acetylglucosamine synthase-like glycosyltransferase